MEQIRAYFDRISCMSDADWSTFASYLTRRQFDKKTQLVKAGQTENHLSFIEKGVVRQYIPFELEEVTFGFAFAGSFVSAYDSFLTQTPSTYNLETLTETVVWQITHSDLQKIYRDTQIGNTLGRHASETLFLQKSGREISLLTESAQERYLRLFTERPHLIQQIPLKHLASYIGITPQALSRIRRRISQ